LLVLAVPPSEGGIATMTVTVTRAPRDALDEEMFSDLTAVGPIYLALSKGEGEEARRSWRSEPELRPLDAIGWSPVEPLDRLAIQMRLAVLVRALGRLWERAVHVLVSSHRALAQLADEQAGERSGSSMPSTAPSRESIRRATPVASTVPVGAAPTAVAADERSVWVTDAGAGALVAMDPAAARSAAATTSVRRQRR
jgi:hypothetical protein